jgi:Protein of unknown function (DUF3995)
LQKKLNFFFAQNFLAFQIIILSFHHYFSTFHRKTLETILWLKVSIVTLWHIIYRMTTIAIFINTLLFIAIGTIHIYWAFGGKRLSEGVLPLKADNSATFQPGILPTLIVAFGLFGFAAIRLAFSKNRALWNVCDCSDFCASCHW